jgi:tRNA(Ile)-lysidine synthetase-like protein
MNAVAWVPAGRWAVGVSGGADSVALLTLLRSRSDLSLHVAHLNHQTRGGESDGDAAFVADLAARLGVPCTIDDRERLEREAPNLQRNPSARYRRLRMALFDRVVREGEMNGVLLAHHADDQAETILQRLLRGSGYSGLAGMAGTSVIGGLRCVRPLLRVRRDDLRQWLHESNQPWRDDSSNASPKYLRNRLRRLLANDPSLRHALLELGSACASMRTWELSAIPAIVSSLDVRVIGNLPHILARAMARKWLMNVGVPPAMIEPETIARLLAMCLDASTPSRTQFPGGVAVARRKGKIEKINSA